MGHAVKDFATGTVPAMAGLLAGSIILVAFFLVGFFLQLLSIMASLLFSAALLVFAVWLAGFTYRKVKEMKKQ